MNFEKRKIEFTFRFIRNCLQSRLLAIHKIENSKETIHLKQKKGGGGNRFGCKKKYFNFTKLFCSKIYQMKFNDKKRHVDKHRNENFLK